MLQLRLCEIALESDVKKIKNVFKSPADLHMFTECNRIESNELKSMSVYAPCFAVGSSVVSVRSALLHLPSSLAVPALCKPAGV